METDPGFRFQLAEYHGAKATSCLKKSKKEGIVILVPICHPMALGCFIGRDFSVGIYNSCYSKLQLALLI